MPTVLEELERRRDEAGGLVDTKFSPIEMCILGYAAQDPNNREIAESAAHELAYLRGTLDVLRGD